jgi:hypothetical protein
MMRPQNVNVRTTGRWMVWGFGCEKPKDTCSIRPTLTAWTALEMGLSRGLRVYHVKGKVVGDHEPWYKIEMEELPSSDALLGLGQNKPRLRKMIHLPQKEGSSDFAQGRSIRLGNGSFIVYDNSPHICVERPMIGIDDLFGVLQAQIAPRRATRPRVINTYLTEEHVRGSFLSPTGQHILSSAELPNTGYRKA